jgi:hypothetical protein
MSRVILGEDDAGEFKLTIDDKARLTFGPNAPYASKKEFSTGRQDGWSLRIYDGDRLLACMTNTKWFRETSIAISRVVEKVHSETVWKDGDGNYEHTTTRNVSKQLVEHSDTGEGYIPVDRPKKGKK